MTCINCGTEVANKFCPQCGQPNPPRKLSFGNLYHDFQARIYGFDGMFPRTLRDLTLRPGHAARVFISGNRVLYYGPAGYFFFMITLLLLVMSLLDVDLLEFMKQARNPFSEDIKPGSGQDKFTQAMFKFIMDNIKLFSFALIPLQAFAARFIFFRKSGYSYLENTVLPFYVQGHIYWMTILSVIYYKISGSIFPNSITISLAIVYFGFAYANFATYQSRIKAFFKGLGVYLVAQVIFVLLVVIGLFIFISLYPELLK